MQMYEHVEKAILFLVSKRHQRRLVTGKKEEEQRGERRRKRWGETRIEETLTNQAHNLTILESDARLATRACYVAR